MHKLLAELKRRHVTRVAIFYAAAAWLLVQISDLILENFNQPAQMMQILIFCVALGFPVAILLAWIFGGRASDKQPSERSDSPQAEQLNTAVPTPDRHTATAAAQDRPGIVVLPFDNYSEELVDQIACSGFTEDLTTLLAQIPGFFVISRNTAQSYKGKSRDLREIGQELGVRYLLEGSLRRRGDLVRVTAQLIEAETGSHLWADNYDAPLNQLDQVQDELMDGIVLQLGSELARAEYKLAQRQRPGDMDAWSLYQSARAR